MDRRGRPFLRVWERGLRNLCSWAVALLFLLPLFWVLAGSLRPAGLPPPRAVEWFPITPDWSNYSRAFDLLPFGRYLVNSLLVAGTAIPLTLVTASWAAFAMLGLNRGPRKLVLTISLGLLLVPLPALWITRYILFGMWGVLDTYAALLAPALMGSSPLFVLLYYRAFRQLPEELFASAEVDGAGVWTQWHALALPLTGPASVAVSVMTFILYWSDFLNPLLYLKSDALYTLPIGLQQLQQLDRSSWPVLMAACVVYTAPTLLFFMVFQRRLLEEGPLSGGDG